ncbi:MAG: hypothetical protein QOK49_3926 [Baekduia sp.]|nr:hypothetical protein [Baekduia sp.]
MVWVILAAVGVPLWLCAAAIATLVLRNRSLRGRAQDIPIRVRTDPEKRWRRGHGVWTHDVLSFRASPAAWKESLLWVTGVEVRPATTAEEQKLHRLGQQPVVAELTLHDGATLEVAACAADADSVCGPYRGASTLTPTG